MKTKISFLSLMVGAATFGMAQSAPPAGNSTGGSGASTTAQASPGLPAQGNNGQNQTVPPQNGSQSQMNRVMPGVSTNSMSPANTNWPGSYNGNNGATNGNGMSGINGAMGTMGTNKFNPYANYTNPNSTYINPNTTNINRYATYTNPYAIDATNNSSLNTNMPAGFAGNNAVTNFNNLNRMTNRLNIRTNRLQ